MAMPRSITVVHAGLSRVFNKTITRIPSSGTCNHQGMPYRPRITTACIRLQHTIGARCGPDQGSVVENRHTTGLKVVAPGLLEKIQLCEVCNNNVFK